ADLHLRAAPHDRDRGAARGGDSRDAAAVTGCRHRGAGSADRRVGTARSRPGRRPLEHRAGAAAGAARGRGHRDRRHRLRQPLRGHPAERWPARAAAPQVLMARERLHGSLSTVEYFTFGFGSMIGVGWLVLMDDWLTRGGPAGGILGFLLG